MADSTTSTKGTGYLYTIGGEAFGVPHEAGDDVPSGVPDKKLKEWERAGVVKKKPKPKKNATKEKST